MGGKNHIISHFKTIQCCSKPGWGETWAAQVIQALLSGLNGRCKLIAFRSLHLCKYLPYDYWFLTEENWKNRQWLGLDELALEVMVRWRTAEEAEPALALPVPTQTQWSVSWSWICASLPGVRCEVRVLVQLLVPWQRDTSVSRTGFFWPAALVPFPKGAPSLCADTTSCTKEKAQGCAGPRHRGDEVLICAVVTVGGWPSLRAWWAAKQSTALKR